VLGTGVATVATAGGRPSALPAARPGHPGNPVVIRDAAFTVTGRAGSLVHVRLRTPLDAPHPVDTRRYAFSSTGDWGALVLRREHGPDALEVAAVRPQAACGKPSCPNATLVDSSPVNAQIAPGDYVLALAGPAGATVSYTLRGFDGTERMTTVRHLYAVPFASAPVPGLPAPPPTVSLYHMDRGAWTLPTTGRRMLAGVVLAVHPTQGGGYDFALCPGAFGTTSTQTAVVTTARPTCSGYSVTTGSVVARSPVDHPLPGSDDEYANVSGASSFGEYEGVTGGAYAVHCNRPPCQYTAAAYVLALDS
jgi:hypothetical protein